ncbi:hypothetical protein OZ411_20520 [Bradyrhizobium sp. Arg237L]|uniref:hypothetical protein n=1 Tax=Bradyrhizobium sp. Arg237L TaxID=3003352 RepID=UPI00249F0308|nr:hypothetical protein [Bradyrhizobium sp. Arg237L]MDI4235193.1 hypothetical protein [Bradyrhizobium sp. Arg237L]
MAQSKLIRISVGSRDTDDRRLREKIGLAGAKAEPDISVLEHLPFCMAVSDEAAEIGHHANLRRIGVNKTCDRIGHCPAAASLLAFRVCVECTPRKHRLKRSFRQSIGVGDQQRLQ